MCLYNTPNVHVMAIRVLLLVYPILDPSLLVTAAFRFRTMIAGDIRLKNDTIQTESVKLLNVLVL